VKFLLSLSFLAIFFSFTIAQETVECEEGLRAFEHDAGVNCIPENPERIVAFDTAATELFLALDRQPVLRSGFLDDFFVSAFPDLEDELAQLMGELDDMGFPINQEVLLSAAPDVIITNTDFAPLFPENTSEIAPLIVLPTDVDWKDKLLMIGDVLGEVEATEQLISQYDERVEAFREAVPNADEIEVSIVRVQGGDFSINLSGAFASQIVAEAGLSRPESQSISAEEALTLYEDADSGIISQERLDLLDADYILLYNAFPDPDVRAENQALIDGLEDDPLFSALGAAQNDRVFQVGGYWYGQGIYSAHGVIDDLFRVFAETEPPIPNPLVDMEEEE
jgi:iron complex transport system substrate-binding protein